MTLEGIRTVLGQHGVAMVLDRHYEYEPQSGLRKESNIPLSRPLDIGWQRMSQRGPENASEESGVTSACQKPNAMMTTLAEHGALITTRNPMLHASLLKTREDLSQEQASPGT